MRGFIVGTLVTAVAFWILAVVLPSYTAFDLVTYDGDPIGLVVIAVVTAVSVIPGRAAALRAAAHRFGTPAYVTDLDALADAARSVTEAFPDPWLRAFSVKANDVPAVIAAIAAHGFAANVVSRGEWT